MDSNLFEGNSPKNPKFGTPRSLNPSRTQSQARTEVAKRRTSRVKSSKRLAKPERQNSTMVKFLGGCFRLTIVAIGLSLIAGTTMAFWQSASITPVAPVNNEAIANIPEVAEIPELKPKTEIVALTDKINRLALPQPDLSLEVFMLDLDNGGYINIKGGQPIAAASMIKIPLLVAFLQDVDSGKAKLDEKLTLTKDVLSDNAGELQYQPLGTKISALETLTLMIVISDNSATNMIMKRLGGKEVANQRFASWELPSTVIRNSLPDLKGTNTTSPEDLVNLLSMVEQGKILTPRSRDRLMDIMRRTKTNTLLPQGIAPDARIAHKTGDIQSVVGDTGIVDMPNGKRYVISAIVKRPTNDQRANELIRQVSRTVYNHFKGAS